jgi:hypothetical protein
MGCIVLFKDAAGSKEEWAAKMMACFFLSWFAQAVAYMVPSCNDSMQSGGA